MEEKLLSMKAASERLGVSRATFYRFMDEGKITPYYRPAQPRTPLFRKEDIDALFIATPKTSAMNQTLHKKAKQRDGGTCLICKSTRLVTAHHVIPIEQGGADTLENLVTLCKDCNTSIHGTGWSLLKKAKRHGTVAVAHWLLQQAGHEI